MNGRSIAYALVALVAGSLTALADAPKEAHVRNLVRSIGYGAGIHNFKNYVLRGNDDYRTKAEADLAGAEESISALRKGDLTDKEKEGLNGIEKVVKQYRANLPVAQKMKGEGKSIAEIDKAVKVDDAPGVAGLAALSDGRTWSNLEKLEMALGYVGAIHHFKNYVLRNTDGYRTDAIARFKDVNDAIQVLRSDKGLSDAKRKALDDIQGVVDKYVANVEVAQKMIGEKKEIAEIDKAVKVDDAPATAALAVLRKD